MKYLNTYSEFENINIPIEVGSEIYGGRFKNKKTTVKSISKDENGEPLVNNKPLLKYKLRKPKSKKEKE